MSANPFYHKRRYVDQLHQGALASTHQNARTLRHNQTEAKEKLWSLLRNRQLKGRKFRRQHAIAHYVLDFYCHECKLAIELDGEQHRQPDACEYDLARTALLKDYNITVLRFWNAEVLHQTEQVLNRIAAHL